MKRKLFGLSAAVVVIGTFVLQETAVVSFRYLLPCIVVVLGVAAFLLFRRRKPN